MFDIAGETAARSDSVRLDRDSPAHTCTAGESSVELSKQSGVPQNSILLWKWPQC